jgi:hypothetical protein
LEISWPGKLRFLKEIQLFLDSMEHNLTFPTWKKLTFRKLSTVAQHNFFSQNEIRSIRKKTLSHLLSLNLSDNRLKELDGLEVPKMQVLNLSNNR